MSVTAQQAAICMWLPGAGQAAVLLFSAARVVKKLLSIRWHSAACLLWAADHMASAVAA
jgi:hypothetical protein